MKKFIAILSLVFFLSISTFAARPVRDACNGVTPNRPNTSVLKAKKATERYYKMKKKQEKSIEKANKIARSGTYVYR